MLIEYLVLVAVSLTLVYIPIKNRTASLITRIIAYVLPFAGYFTGLFDSLSMAFLGLAIPVGLMSSLYNLWYGESKYPGRNLQLLIDVFNLSIIYTFAAPNLLTLIALWTVSEIVGFLLVSFEGGDEAFRAGYRFFFLKGLTFELSALTIAVILSYNVGLSTALLSGFDELPKISISLIYAVLATIGFITTSAIVPLHFWLPHAHSTAPSSASAVLSGLTVKMGFYAFLRITQFMDVPREYWYGLLVLGAVTAFYGFTVLLVQRDVKRLLAYSTIGNTGFIAVLLSIYMLESNKLLYLATIINIYAHGLYKASLFINTGTIIVLAHTRDMGKLSGLVAFTPYSSLGVLFTVLSIIGVPPTVGFVGKLLAIISLLGISSELLMVMGLIVVAYAILVSIIYGFNILGLHWRYTEIDFKPNKIPDYPQLIELLLGSMGIIYGVLLLLFFDLGALNVLILINAFSLLLVIALVAVFHYNIRPRIVRELGSHAVH